MAKYKLKEGKEFRPFLGMNAIPADKITDAMVEHFASKSLEAAKEIFDGFESEKTTTKQTTK